MVRGPDSRGARDRVGAFREGPSPLRDWLLRAVRAESSIELWDEPVARQVLRFLQPLVLPLPDLVPNENRGRNGSIDESLKGFDLRYIGVQVKSPTDSVALAAGLFQMNDLLDESHHLSQSIEGAGRHGAGDYWHAIMHRREPDYFNAKYWFRRVGRKEFHSFLAAEADAILSRCTTPAADGWRKRLSKGGWDSTAFVDLCEQLENDRDSELSFAARSIQQVEMTLLLASTYHDAVS